MISPDQHHVRSGEQAVCDWEVMGTYSQPLGEEKG